MTGAANRRPREIRLGIFTGVRLYFSWRRRGGQTKHPFTTLLRHYQIGLFEGDDELFSLSDYTDPSATFTSYGGLKWDNGGTISPIGRFILAAAIDDTGTLYMARNRALGGFQAPVLLKFNLNNVSTTHTTQDNVAAVVGTVRTGVGLRGLCFDPTDSSLYGSVSVASCT